MKRFLVVSFLKALPPGTEFPSSRWPLHVTIVPPFRTETEASALLEALPERSGPIDLDVGEPARFGAKKDVTVMLIKNSKPLNSLHRRVLAKLDPLGIEYKDSRHIGDNYRPHITKQRDQSVSTGDRVQVDSLSLVDMSVPGKRTVIDSLSLY